MPLYEYECEKGHRFEVIRKFSDPPVDTCPTCGTAVRKLMSSPAIQFKGSGWYITDYAKKDSAPARSETKTDSSDGAKETKTGSTDSKDAAAAKPAAESKPAKSE